ncbi:MAG: TonB-dependent receptor, partial [Bacteroides sp.]
MKNKLLLLFLLLSFLTTVGYAQQAVSSSYSIKGVLLDSLTQEGEPYATIRIVKKEAPAKALKMAVTDMKGRFQEKMSALPGLYTLTISSIGKITVVKDFTLKPEEKTVDLGTLYTAEATNELKGVEVIAQKPLVKADIDKIEYNVQDDPDSKSNTVLEMLRKVPLVTVDGEDNIKVNGSSSFKIHVNGKPDNMMSNNPVDVLKSM